MIKVWMYPYIRLTAGLLIFAASLLLRRAFTRFTVNQLKRLAARQDLIHMLAIIDRTVEPLRFGVVVIGFYIATRVAWLPDRIADTAALCAQSLLSVTVFWLFYRMVHAISEGLASLREHSGYPMSSEFSTLMTITVKILVVFIGAMSVLQQWGINIVAFLGGLGLMGMAVALAAQDTVKNFFGSLTIFADHIFKKGEQIKTPDVEGTVEAMGLRTTTLRQTDKALVVVPNAKLADAPIVNITRITEHFVKWSIAIDVDVTSAQLERALKRIRETLSKHPQVETNGKKTPVVIRLDRFNEGSIELLCHFFIKKMLWEEFMGVKEDCLLIIKRILEDEAIPLARAYSSAYPSTRSGLSAAEDEYPSQPETPRTAKIKQL